MVPLDTEDKKVNSLLVIIRAFVYAGDILPPGFPVTTATLPNCERGIRYFCVHSGEHKIWSAGYTGAGTQGHSIE